MSEQIPEQMRAWAVKVPAPIESDPCPLQLVKKPVPTPAPARFWLRFWPVGSATLTYT